MPRSAASTSLEILHAPSRPLRRLTLELLVVVALKIGLLLLIWWLLFAPQLKPDVSPAAISQLLAPMDSAAPEVRP